MNEALHHLRKIFFTRLNNTITSNSATVPAYNKVPRSATAPYIKIYSVSTSEIDQNKDSYIINCETRVEVVTAFDGDSGGELQVNQITDSVINKLRTRTSGLPDLSDVGFSCYTSTIENVQYLEEDLKDRTYYRAVVEISNRVEKI